MVRTPSLLVFSLLWVASCGQLRPEPMPYRFSAPMIDGQPSRSARTRRSRRRAARKVKQPRSEAWRARALRRCRQLAGSTTTFQSTRELLQAIYGSRLPTRIDWRAITLRRRLPRPADLVIFDIGRGRIKVGVVTKLTGARVRFAHLVGERVRAGWLHLQQPNRRRLSMAGSIANSYVRPRAPDDEADARYLAGQLLSGFGTPPVEQLAASR